MQREFPYLDAERAKKPERVPVVLSQTEVTSLLRQMRGVPLLFGQLLYGSGLRHFEGLSLSVKHVDLDRRPLVIRESKGGEGSCDVAYLAAQFCNSFAGGRVGYSHSAGVIGTCRCEYDDDLYSCVAARPVGGEEYAGSALVK